MNLFSIFDPYIFGAIFGLSGLSLFILTSTASILVFSQAANLVVGVILLIVIASIDYRIWSKFIWVIYAASILLLAITFLGPNVRGTTRWIDLAGARLQPSEIVKPLFILVMSFLFSRCRRLDLKSILLLFAAFLPVALLIYKQPDLGNVIVYLFVFVTFILLSRISLRFAIVGALIFLTILPGMWVMMRPYQRDRVMSYINPHADPTGTGYNALQSMIAIGSGGIFGLGLGRGTQSRLLFLPEYHTDFIFASLGEELGLAGGILVLSFCALLLGRLLKIAGNIDDPVGSFMVLGVFAQIFIQVFINIGMNLGLLPITGITLPLVSYGGSSVISTCIGLGLVISVEQSVKRNPLVIG